MASDVLMTISRDEEERFRIMREEKTRLDWQSYMGHERKEGIAEGRAEGRAEEREEIARNALGEGASIEFVSKITGLDLEAIEALGDR